MRVNLRVRPLLILAALGLTVYHVHKKWKDSRAPKWSEEAQASNVPNQIVSSKTWKEQQS